MRLRDFLERYGVSLTVLAALALVVALLPSNVRRAPFEPGSARRALAGPAGLEPGGQPGPEALQPNEGPSAPPSPGRGGQAGTRRTPGVAGTGPAAAQPSVVFGQGPCRADGRMKGVSLYMPPCLKWLGGDNGGSTWRGVTRDAIKVVRWVSTRDPATEAILEGYKLADPPEIVKRAYDALRIYGNHHYETYGREVQMVDYQSAYNSSNPDDQILKSDAVRIANEIKAFAVIVGDPAAQIPTVLARELAQRGVVCICTVSLSSQFYRENPPLIWGSLPTADEYAMTIAEYIGKRLVGPGRTARWAGDNFAPLQGFRSRARKFGLIYLEGAYGVVDPEGKRARDLLVRELAKYGISLAAEHGYLYEPGRNQNDVTNLIVTMRNAGVTTVIGMWDPLYPILITREASNQNYWPEWFISGTGLADTTTAGRLYQNASGGQWGQAFGVSPLWLTWRDVRKSAGYREFYHARPDIQPGSCGQTPCEGVLINIYRAYWQTLFQGIQLAGPYLTPETFALGMLSYPRTGGAPTAPLFFRTRDFPTEIKDFTEVFFAADEAGPDERGDQGVGTIMKVDGGRRYVAGQWPSSDPAVFNKAGAVALADPTDPPHEQDGHRHTGRCLSCQ